MDDCNKEPGAQEVCICTTTLRIINIGNLIEEVLVEVVENVDLEYSDSGSV